MDWVDLVRDGLIASALVGAWVWWRQHSNGYGQDKKWQAVQRVQLAQQMGWRHEIVKTPFINMGDRKIEYRFQGETQTGQPWEMRFEDVPSGTPRYGLPKLVWEMLSLKSTRKEFEISDGYLFDSQQTALGLHMVSAVAPLTRLPGPRDEHMQGDFLQTAQAQAVGSDAFRHHFKAIARQVNDVAHFVTPDIEALLLQWPQTLPEGFGDVHRRISIQQDNVSLRIEFLWDTIDPALYPHMVHLGLALAARVGRT